MARLINETFKSTGYCESGVTEAIAGGNTLTEGISDKLFSAGSTAPTSLNQFVLQILKNTSTSSVYSQFSLGSGYSTIYLRVHFMIKSNSVTDNVQAGIFTVTNSGGTSCYRLRARYSSGTTRLLLTWVNTAGAATTQPGGGDPISLNTWNIYEVVYINSATCGIGTCRLNESQVYTFQWQTGGTTARNIKNFRIGHDSAESLGYEIYFDNIRANDDTGTTHNTWPGSDFNLPLRSCEHLSTQRLIAMEL